MALTPTNASDSLINKLSESEAETLASAKIASDLDRALKLLANPETMFRPEREDKYVVNLRRAYDLHFEYQSAAPKDERWSCIDLNTYDGAPDSTGMSTYIGRGAERKLAMLDLLDKFGEFDE